MNKHLFGDLYVLGEDDGDGGVLDVDILVLEVGEHCHRLAGVVTLK